MAARILLDFDADSEKIRNEVIRALYRQSNPEATEDPDEQELRRYFERRAKDRRKQAPEGRNEDRLTRAWARRIGRTRALAGVRSYLERRSEDLPPERVRASGLLVWEAMKQALPEDEQDRALSKEEFNEAIRRLDPPSACSLTYGTWKTYLSPRSLRRERGAEAGVSRRRARVQSPPQQRDSLGGQQGAILLPCRPPHLRGPEALAVRPDQSLGQVVPVPTAVGPVLG